MRQVLFGGSSSNLSTSAAQNKSIFGQQTGPKQLIARDGTLTSFRVVLDTAPGAGTDYTFTVFKNGLTTGISITISGTNTSGSDNSVLSISAGDIVEYQVVPTGTPTAAKYRSSVIYQNNSDNESIVATSRVSNLSNSANRRVGLLETSARTTDVEAEYHNIMPMAGTLKNLYVELSSAPGSSRSWDITVIKNGTATSLTVNISGSGVVTGSDLVNTVSFVAGDTLSILITPNNTPTFGTSMQIGAVIAATNNGDYVVGLGASNIGFSASSTTYIAISSNGDRSFTEGEKEQLAQGVGKIKRCDIKLDRAPGSGTDFTFTLMKNGSDVSGFNGTIADTSTTVTITQDEVMADDDLYQIKVVPTNTPASAYATGVSFLLESPVSPAAVTKSLLYEVLTSPVIQKTLQYVVGDKYFSREMGSLKTTDQDLATIYSAQDITDVETDDGVRVGIQGNGTGYLQHLYKFFAANNTDNITVDWNGQVDIAPSSRTVFLQIYNYNTSSWETLDSDNSSGAQIDFNLSGSITANQSNYYGAGNRISARIYQQIN